MLGWRVIPRIGFDGFGVSPHGIGIAFGYFIGAMLMARRARNVGYNEDHVWNGAAVGVIGAMLGARIAYVGGHFSEFESPVEWLKIWQGGISLVGGLLGAFAAVLIYTRVKKISFFELVDLGAPGLAIGIALGRLGDLAIGDHLGKETSGFWGWKYLGGQLISPPPCITPEGAPVYSTFDGCIAPGTIVHQTALYDMVWSFGILAILMVLSRRPRNRGFMFLTWAALYAVGRIGTDFLRVDKHWFGLGLTGSQLTSIAVLLICTFFLIRFKGVPTRPEPETSAGTEAAVPAEAAVPDAAASAEPAEPETVTEDR